MHKALKGRGPRRAEGPEGIVTKKDKFTESPTVLMGLILTTRVEVREHEEEEGEEQ